MFGSIIQQIFQPNLKSRYKALIYFYVWIQVWFTTSTKKADILCNKLYTGVPLRVAERLNT